jgi:acyl-CoA-dependent ceramide synthase
MTPQYIHVNLPTKLSDPTYLWRDYPHIPLSGPVKCYYLIQAAFYLHQMLILNAEARRKDHFQMMTHHVITIALIGASYYTNFTRVGCLVLVLMDWCDIWLPVSSWYRGRYLMAPNVGNHSSPKCCATLIYLCCVISLSSGF